MTMTMAATTSAAGFELGYADEFARRGADLLAEEQWVAALGCFEAALAVAEHDASIWAQRARAYVGLKLYWRALHDLDEAIRLAPDHGLFFQLRGETYGRIGQAKPALADFTAALALGGQRPAETVNSRGEIYFRSERFREAHADFNVAIALDFTFFKPYLNRALLYSKVGRHADALVEVGRAVRLAPHEGQCYAAQGLIQAGSGHVQAAVDSYTEALRLHPTADVLYRRAAARLQANDVVGALMDLEMCLRTDTSHEEARQERAALLERVSHGHEIAQRWRTDLAARFADHPSAEVRQAAAGIAEALRAG